MLNALMNLIVLFAVLLGGFCLFVTMQPTGTDLVHTSDLGSMFFGFWHGLMTPFSTFVVYGGEWVPEWMMYDDPAIFEPAYHGNGWYTVPFGIGIIALISGIASCFRE